MNRITITDGEKRAPTLFARGIYTPLDDRCSTYGTCHTYTCTVHVRTALTLISPVVVSVPYVALSVCL